jgi:AcrR family transcriptional regulator
MATSEKTKQQAVPRRTQAQRRQKSTANMLEAAAQLFARQGFERTTLAQIAAQSGYSSGLIVHRFGSKVELVKALVRDIQARSRDEIFGPMLAITSPVECIDRLIQLYTDAALAAETPLRALFVLMAESVGHLGELREVFARHNQAFVLLFETQILKGQETGEIYPTIDARLTASEIVSLLRGVMLLWLIDPDSIAAREIVQTSRRGILEKLAPSTAPLATRLASGHGSEARPE